MTTRFWIVTIISSCLASVAACQEAADISVKYKALKCPPPSLGTTWAILEHDGANREVDPYLSSLGQGESGTGTISSPAFKLDVDAIRFTICGHDGQDGKRGENYIALIDGRKGTALRKATAPANNALQSARGTLPNSKARKCASKFTTELQKGRVRVAGHRERRCRPGAARGFSGRPAGRLESDLARSGCAIRVCGGRCAVSAQRVGGRAHTCQGGT